MRVACIVPVLLLASTAFVYGQSTPTVRTDGTGVTFTLTGVTSPTVDPDKVAQTFISCAAPGPSGTTTKKVQAASMTAVQSGSNTEVSVEFMPHADNPLFAPLVYSTDDDASGIKLSMPAGTVSGTGGSNPAYSNSTISSSSTLAYPQAIGVWAVPPFQRFSGSVILEVAAFNASGVNAVELYHTGTSPGGTGTLVGTQTSMSAAATPAWLVAQASAAGLTMPPRCYLYQFVVDVSNTTSYPNGTHYFDFRVVPRLGGTPGLLDTRSESDLTWGTTHLPVRINAGSLAQSVLWIDDDTGSNTTGNGTELTPYRTAQHAYDQLATKDGGIINVKAGTYTGTELQIQGMNNPNEWVYVRADPNATAGAILYNPAQTVQPTASCASGAPRARLCYQGIKFVLPKNADSGGGSTTSGYLFKRPDSCTCTCNPVMLWLRDCWFDGTINQSFGVAETYYPETLDGVFVTGCFFESSSVMAAKANIARDVAGIDGRGDCFQNAGAVINTVVSSWNALGSDHLDWAQFVGSPLRTSNVVLYQNQALAWPCNEHVTSFIGLASSMTRVAVVAYLADLDTVGTGCACVMSIGAGDHTIVWHMTVSHDGSEGTAQMDLDSMGAHTRTVRNSAFMLVQDLSTTFPTFRTAYGHNWNSERATGFLSVYGLVPDSTDEADESDLYLSPSGHDFRPKPGSLLRGRVESNAVLIPADAAGMAYRGDGTDPIGALRGFVCCVQDFNGDGDASTDQDIEAYFACLGGDCCEKCGSADFNCDGDIGNDQDIESFFRVLGGGAC